MNVGHDDIGAVIIGRNEGDRLRQSIESVIGTVRLVVYVDSGSTDDSIAVARQLNAHVIELDNNIPFTAARARNVGLHELLRLQPDIQYIQFIDGDCEVIDGWIQAAHEYLSNNVDCAVVCGRRRERYPDRTIYNRLTDMEWDTPIGEAKSCGGDALMRIKPLLDVGGYNGSLIAGEEPELCKRLRAADWRVQRINQDMTMHDADIVRFSQWWQRAVRCGHAYAEGRAMHGRSAERFRVDEVRSIIEWTVILPVIAIGLAPFTYGVSLLLFSAYGLLIYRVRRYWLGRGYDKQKAHRASVFNVIGKFAELIGIGTYWWNRLRNTKSTLIEYKTSSTPEVSNVDTKTTTTKSSVAMEVGSA